MPSLKKAAFIVGGEYGKGLMSCRHDGDVESAGVHAPRQGQLGAPVRRAGNRPRAARHERHRHGEAAEEQVSLGAEASVAAGPVGRDARAATDAQMKAEILSYSRTQGVFAGVNLSGGVVRTTRMTMRICMGRASARSQSCARGVFSCPASPGRSSRHWRGKCGCAGQQGKKRPGPFLPVLLQRSS